MTLTMVMVWTKKEHIFAGALILLALAAFFCDETKSAGGGRRILLQLGVFQDPKSVNLRPHHNYESSDATTSMKTSSAIGATGNSAEAAIPCMPNDEGLVSVPEFYNGQHDCHHDFSKSTIFFHIGKAGGGTVEHNLKKALVSYSLSHPIPALRFQQELQRPGGLDTLIVNVRDPLDRFVSAFKWDLMRTCDRPSEVPFNWRCCRPNGAFGEKLRDEETVFLLQASCEMSFRREKILREKYNSDPNNLALALCGNDSSKDYQTASEDYSLIEHGTKLTKWLDFLIGQNKDGGSSGIQNLVVLPMEKQAGGEELFEEHIDGFILHLLQTRYGPELGTNIMQQVESKNKEGASRHSTSAISPPPLTTFGECCMTRYLEDDYRLIQTMLGKDYGDVIGGGGMTNVHPVIYKACTSWGTTEQQQLCQSDLASMLKRRAIYLDRSRGTCSQMFG
ncbi:hypothetical protein ACHAXR_011346 [Thalassiosira sp. AJA248-18]